MIFDIRNHGRLAYRILRIIGFQDLKSTRRTAEIRVESVTFYRLHELAFWDENSCFAVFKLMKSDLEYIWSSHNSHAFSVSKTSRLHISPKLLSSVTNCFVSLDLCPKDFIYLLGPHKTSSWWPSLTSEVDFSAARNFVPYLTFFYSCQSIFIVLSNGRVD